MSSLLNLTGQRFGRLTVIERDGSNSNHAATWRCICDCGNYVTTSGILLRSGATVSCGCNKAEKARDRMTTHGLSRTLIYDIWSSMKARCTRESCKDYKNYGGRGISFYPAWSDFVSFYNWAMENGYKEHLTIERIDVNGNYEPSNCRWIPNCEQSRNRRISKRVLYDGKSLSTMEWSKCLNINYNTLRAYLGRGDTMKEIVGRAQ